MNSKDIDLGHMALAITWWLSYTSAVGRNYVLSEAAIKFPASEYLERSEAKYIELEYPHPYFSRKRFDLQFVNADDEAIVFEFKYIKGGSTRTQDEKQRIFNDLMRLFFFLEEGRRSYFLICDNQGEFIANFQNILLSPCRGGQFIMPESADDDISSRDSEGFYAKWFSFDVDSSEVIINLDDDENYANIYQAFFDEYKGPYREKINSELVIPKGIKTNLMYISTDIRNSLGVIQPAKIGIWEILRA